MKIEELSNRISPYFKIDCIVAEGTMMPAILIKNISTGEILKYSINNIDEYNEVYNRILRDTKSSIRQEKLNELLR